MAELGYYAQVEGGVFGQPDGGNSDPVTRAELQEASAVLSRSFTTQPGYVPACYVQMAAGNPPIIGWTVQKDAGSPFRPYTPTGHIPDWTSDVNPIGAGSFDMNQEVSGSFGFDPANRAPIGGAVLEYGEDPNANKPTTDVGGTIGDLEY